MARFLGRLGAFFYHKSWWVIASWLVVLAVSGLLASQLMRPLSSEITIPGIEAQQAVNRANQLFPDNGKSQGQIVFATNGSTKVDDYQQNIADLLAKVSQVPGVLATVNPLDSGGRMVSSDGRIAYAVVQLKDDIGQIDESTLDKIQSDISGSRVHGLQIESNGALIEQMPSELLGPGEISGVLLALVVLIVTFGSLVASGMPVLVALIGVGVSASLLLSLSPLVSINTTTPVLGVMLGLAVGIDYSLFIVNRYRLFLREGYDGREATRHAMATSGNAVVFAASTVIIALAALSIIGIPFMTMMGLAGAGSVAIAALVALTLLPAMFGIFGKRVLARKVRKTAALAVDGEHTKSQNHSFWHRWGELLVRRPWTVLIIAVVLVGIIILPARNLLLGLPSDQFQPEATTERKAYDLIKSGFGAGYTGPLLVVVERLPKASAADINQLRQKVEAELNRQVELAKKQQQAHFEALAAQATTPEAQLQLQSQIAAEQAAGAQQLKAAQAKAEQTIQDNIKFLQLAKVSDNIAQLRDVDSASPVAALDSGTAGLIQVIPTSAPGDAATEDLITNLRTPATVQSVTSNNGATIAVSGHTAMQADINQKLSDALPEYLIIVVGLSLIILILAFRSILIPLKATLGFLLSVGAMFGAMVAVFQWGWLGIATAPGPIVSFIPIIAVSVLFGLAMDYQFFLVSSIQESYQKTKDVKTAIRDGFATGSRVVTAAGIIMVSIFAGFIFSSDTIIQPIGFGLAFGVLIDAFVVRMTIVPTVLALIGKTAWWLPRWLSKLLPHVSIEGEGDADSK